MIDHPGSAEPGHPGPPSAENHRRPGRRGLVIDGALLLCVLLCGWILLEPGVFSVDESHYLLATDAFAQRGSFQIENGFERYRARELLFFYTVVPDDVEHLGSVSTVPPYHAILAAPFLLLFGLSGMFWLNLLAFAATCIAVRRLAERLKPHGPFALVVAAVFALGSCGLEYALGIWPHALSQALVAWAVLILLQAAESSGRRAWIFSCLAGLLLSAATGVRLQNIVWLPVFLVMSRWALGCSWPLLVSHLAGWILPLAGYSLINLARLGTLNPFTYGTRAALGGSLPVRFFSWVGCHPWVLAIAAVVAAAVFLLWRRLRWRGLLPGLLLAVAGALAVSPELRAISAHWLSMAGFHLIDSAFLPAKTVSMGSVGNQLGQVLYGGVLKKGLLEVAPILVLSLLILFVRKIRPAAPSELGFIAGTGLLGALVLPLVLSAGGLCFNPRYLLEIVPALLVASLYFGIGLSPSWAMLAAGAGLGCGLALPSVLHPGSVGDPSNSLLSMLAPLGVSVCLLAAATLALWKKDPAHGAIRRAAAVVLGAALAYGTMIQLGVDLKRSLTIRHYAGRMLEEGRKVLPDNSALLAWEARKDVFSPLKLDRDILIAGVARGDRNVPDLIRRLIADRRVYALKSGIPADIWAKWSAPYLSHEHESHGLVFVELIANK